MSDYYVYMEQFNHRAKELEARAAQDRLATEVDRVRRGEVKAARRAARTVRIPVVRRLRTLLSP